MFAGLDDIDWASMSHAYGDAAEVPALLRKLIAGDPAVRESALDDMYGAVHHQGDIYDSTLAAVPFLLEIVATPGLAGRAGVVGLLADIGGADDRDEYQPEGKELQARAAVSAARPLLLTLLTDRDVEVRRAAPGALLTVRDDARPVAAALRARFAEEPDPQARRAIVTAVGSFGQRGDDPEAGPWLARCAVEAADPVLRLAATAELARCAPALLPPSGLRPVVGLLRDVYETGVGRGESGGFGTGTLIGAVRRLFREEAQGRRAPEAGELVATLSAALGDRVEDRVALLTALLREDEWDARNDALRPAYVLISGWRGDFRELVTLVGECLFDEHPRLRARAAETLEHLDLLAAPIVDDLARSLGSVRREAPPRRVGLPPWIIRHQARPPAVGATLTALAGARNPRALPRLEWALRRPRMAPDVGYLIGRFGPAASGLVPAMRRRLTDLPRLESGFDRCRGGLAYALGRMGAAAAPAVPELVHLAATDDFFLDVLGQIGPAATEAAPTVRRLLAHGDPSFEIAAAAALWRIDPDPVLVVPVLTRHLDASDGRHVAAAAAAAATIAPAAEAALSQLLGLPGRSDDPSGRIRMSAAAAWWRATGDAEVALPALTETWNAMPHLRPDVLRTVIEMGTAAGGFAALIRAELAARNRHTAGAGISSTSGIPDDLELLRLCEAFSAGHR